MPETSTSLLDRPRCQPDDTSWRRLVEMYTPLIHDWRRRHATLCTWNRWKCASS